MNDKTLSTHISKYHPNTYVNQTNNQVIILNKGTTNIPKNFKKVDISVDSTQKHSEGLPESEDLLLFKRNVNSFLNKSKSYFSIGLININSLLHKFGNIQFMLLNKNLDILVVNETKLDNTRDQTQFEDPNYTLLRRDRTTGNGGGIIIYVKRSYNVFNINLYEDLSSEFISFSIRFLQNDISFIGTYRPPHQNNEEKYFEDLELITNTLECNTKSEETIIIGDLNYDFLVLSCFNLKNLSIQTQQ